MVFLWKTYTKRRTPRIGNVPFVKSIRERCRTHIGIIGTSISITTTGPEKFGTFSAMDATGLWVSLTIGRNSLGRRLNTWSTTGQS